jgi:hypothetical protein
MHPVQQLDPRRTGRALSGPSSHQPKAQCSHAAVSLVGLFIPVGLAMRVSLFRANRSH